MSQLPRSLKKLAYAAEKGSSIDLLHLITAAHEEPASESRYLLPVFYANLHPVGMPTAEMLWNGPEDELVVDPMRRVLMSLKGISNLHDDSLLPLETCSQLWPRVFPWLDFITKYSEFYPQLLQPNIRYALQFDLVAMMLDDPTTATAVQATPGVRAMVARGWTDMLETRTYSHTGRVFGVLCLLMRTLFKTSDTSIVEELSQGTGGTLDDLAIVIVKHFIYVLPEPPTIMDPEAAMSFVSVLRMVMDLHDSTPDIFPFLLSHGIVPALVRNICAFDWEYVPEPIVAVSMQTILRLMTEYPDHRHVVDALRAGFLQGIVASIPMEVDHVLVLLTRILPSYTIYPTVLAKLRRLPPAIDKTIACFDPKVLQTPHFAAWTVFRELIVERTRLQFVFDLTCAPPQLACDNMDCGIISEKALFQRCSGCRSTSYCSIYCQRSDWKEGGHRGECQRKHGHRVGGGLALRDHLFLRELLHHDYESRRREIARLQLNFVESRATEDPDPWSVFYTSFNYTSGRAEITVLPLSKLKNQWRESYLPRLSRSGGRMELHEAVILQGGRARSILFPMRSSERFAERAVWDLRDPEAEQRRRELFGGIRDSGELTGERPLVNIHLLSC